MTESTVHTQKRSVELPDTAPQIRVSAGMGTPGQKTWNLRKPVTVIGSKRPASIVLHDEGVSKSHCVIVNTGFEILIKDLQTPAGTFLKKKPVPLAVLSDGDVVTVGETRMQIAIRTPGNDNDDSGVGMEVSDPTRFSKLVTVQLDRTEKKWSLEAAVALIGRHEKSAICLNHPDVSERHAVLFRFGSGVAVFDLGSRSGVSVNGEKTGLAMVHNGDRVGVGPFTLVVSVPDKPALHLPPLAATGLSSAASATTPVPTTSALQWQVAASEDSSQEELSVLAQDNRDNNAVTDSREQNNSLNADTSSDVDASAGIHVGAGAGADVGADADGTSLALAQIERDLQNLQKNIGSSWERLNSWENKLHHDVQQASGGHEADSTSTDREAELDARDAELRGQLYDLTQYHDQIAKRERELAAQLAVVQEREDRLAGAGKSLAQRETEVTQKAEDLQRREHVLAQRWTRLLSAKCAHCKRPVNVGRSNP